jgi:pyrimidine-nucleoside phosphorylase
MKGQSIIESFVTNPSEETMHKVIQFASSEEITDDDIAFLAFQLAKSGEMLSLETDQIGADIPSTGGPSSLTTLICPLVLVEIGFIVPKLGIMGRPAGGIDTLAQLKGYKIEWNSWDIKKCLNDYQYCHFLVSKQHAPLDSVFFQYRSKVGAKSIPPLVIASILSKKIVSHLKKTGLDVRVAKHGNFGQNFSEASLNSHRFIRVAKKLGIEACCFLSDSSTLEQPYIGRGESLLALSKIFNNCATEQLQLHFSKCIDMALTLSNENHFFENGEFPLMAIYKNFISNILAQGSSEREFQNKVKSIEDSHTNEIIAPKSGFLNIDIEKLRDAIVLGQKSKQNMYNPFPDPCGVIFKKFSNEFIQKGEQILTYRADNSIKDTFFSEISSSIKIDTNMESKLIYQKILK